jgi:hypothetical protein
MMEKEDYAKQFAAMGGRARAAAMTPDERSKASRKAVLARWAKYRKERKRNAKKT